MRSKNADLHGAAPDHSKVALLLIDVINGMDFPEGKRLVRYARPAAKHIAKLKQRAKAAGVPVIYARRCIVLALQRGQHVEPAATRQTEVEQHDVDRSGR
jgi:nicotinamidase-related amidase